VVAEPSCAEASPLSASTAPSPGRPPSGASTGTVTNRRSWYPWHDAFNTEIEEDDHDMNSASCPAAGVTLKVLASGIGGPAATETFHEMSAKSGVRPAGRGGSGGNVKVSVALPGKSVQLLFIVSVECQIKEQLVVEFWQSSAIQKPVPPVSAPIEMLCASHWWVVHPDAERAAQNAPARKASERECLSKGPFA